MYRFSGLVLDPRVRELRRSGQLVHLEPQAFDLLVVLVDRRDRVVAHAELLELVWGHSFVSEAALTTRIKEIRAAVGDDGRQQHTIRNVRGRGYRFVAVLETDGDDGAASMVGRGELVAQVTDRLATTRLLTVVGPGGVGKSSVLRAVVHRAAAHYAEGAVRLDLSSLVEGGEVLPVVAARFDLLLEPDRPERAVDAISRRPALLVLDNCEHLADDVGVLVGELLDRPGAAVRVLAASRVRLGLSEEVVERLEPLESDAAVELFVLRATAARQNVASETLDPAAIRRIVDRLDRLPLTIEMAAARLDSMTLAELEDAVGADGPLLQVSHRTPTRRHRTIGSLVEWSAALLHPDERRVLAECSVFAGGVEASDIDAVVGSAVDGRPASALARRLAEQSLLALDLGGRVGRFEMLETVKVVARTWLEREGARASVSRRHARHFLGVARRVDADLRGPEEVFGRELLARVVPEFRTAHAWSVGLDPEVASDLCAALHLAVYSSFWAEPVRWSEAVVERVGADHPVPGAHAVIAGAAASRGDLELARRHLEALQGSAAPHLRGIALEIGSDVAIYAGELEYAQLLCGQLTLLAEETGDAHLWVVGMVNHALVMTFGGAPAEAAASLAGLDLERCSVSDRAWIEYARGEAFSELGGDGAAHAYRSAIDLARAASNPFVASVARMSLATELARSGDQIAALEGFSSVFEGCLRHGNFVHALTAVRNLVGVLAAVGDHHNAVVLGVGSRAEGFRHSYGAESDRMDEVLDDLTSVVGPDRYEAWSDEAAGSSIDDLVVRAAGALTPYR